MESGSQGHQVSRAGSFVAVYRGKAYQGGFFGREDRQDLDQTRYLEEQVELVGDPAESSELPPVFWVEM